ncbi:hypothetical protein ACEQ8H_002751 [Pleosporales sp. CAS-2024a]
MANSQGRRTLVSAGKAYLRRHSYKNTSLLNSSSNLPTSVSEEDPGAMEASGSSPHQSSAEQEEDASEEFQESFDCEDCEGSYSSKKALNRHRGDKKTKCYKNREARDDQMPSVWSCPRCQLPLSNKYSATRHITEACWKICDECIQSGSEACDSANTVGDCTPCERAGKSCTKHTEQLDNCHPVPVTGDAEVYSAAKKVTAIPAPHQTREKRKAAVSPDTSPKSKPISKRAKNVDQDESDLTGDANKPGSGHNSDGPLAFGPVQDGSDAPSAAFLKPNPHPRTANGGISMRRNASLAAARMKASARQPSSQMGPSVLGVPPSSLNNGAPNAQPTTQEMLARQVQAARALTLGSPYNNFLAPTRYASSHGLSLGQNSWTAPSNDNCMPMDGRPSLASPFGAHEDALQIGSFEQSGDAFPGDIPLTLDPSLLEDSLHLSASGSHAVSHQPATMEGALSAPVSQGPSQQPSRQSSAEHLHLSFDSRLSGDSGALDQGMDRDQPMVKMPIAREWHPNQCQEPSVLHPNPNDPAIRLRIHSNTCDSNGNPIFSILTMGMHDLFGPRLEYYCAQRGKRYDLDWKFVYKYPAPTREKPGRQKYFELSYDMMPSGCRDKDYPDSALGDGDTLLVVMRGANDSHVGDADDEALGTQLACQRIDIQNGETQLWQDLDVNQAWFQKADQQMDTMRHQLNMQYIELQHMRTRAKYHENLMSSLKAQNLRYKGQMEMLKRGRLQYPLRPSMYPARGNMTLPRFQQQQQQQPNPAQNMYNQQFSGYQSDVNLPYIPMPAYSFEPRQYPVYDAGGQVTTQEQEQ